MIFLPYASPKFLVGKYEWKRMDIHCNLYLRKSTHKPTRKEKQMCKHDLQTSPDGKAVSCKKCGEVWLKEAAPNFVPYPTPPIYIPQPFIPPASPYVPYSPTTTPWNPSVLPQTWC